MKKYLIILFCVVVSSIITAQELPKNIFGIRAGLNFSSIWQYDQYRYYYTTGSRKGFSYGFAYQRLLTASTPLYLETGLYLSNKGFTQNVYAKYTIQGPNPIEEELYDFSKTNLSYLQIPILLNYHFNVNSKIRIESFAGLYVAYGVGGKTKSINGTIEDGGIGYHNEIIKSFSSKGFNKIDLGFKFGIGATLYNVYVGAGYEVGAIKSEGEYYEQDNGVNKYNKVVNKNWTIILGYNISLSKK
ncbi:MAG: PorT family protein [Prevotellaceae bacterium]|jgi:hypothetical protein|nr:PorT family protein [Prevotellaceae bacterium]